MTVVLRAIVLTIVVSAAPAAAQSAAECPTSECAPLAATTNPAHAQLWRDAAAIHQIKIAFVEALQRFVRAQAGTFGDEGDELRSSLTTMRERLSSWDQAIQTFQAKASRGAPDAESSIAVATVLLDRHRIDDALRALASAERVDDNRPDLYAMRALAYGALNRPEDAVRALRRAAALDTRDPTLSYLLVQRLTQLQRPDDASQARQALQRSLATTPRRVTFARIGLLSQASGTAPIFPQARYAAGFAALDAGEYTMALAALAEAVERDPIVSSPPEARARVVRAATALRTGQLDDALRDLQATVTAYPSDSEAHRLLGLAYWIDEQSGPSIEQLRTAIRLAPADERARVLLSDVLAADRRLAEAERELLQSAEAGVRSGQIAFRLAQIYNRQSLLPRAATAFAESEAFRPVAGRDAFYQAWGSLLVNQADFAGAIAAYAKRIDVNANSADAHRQLGEIDFLQGRDEEALAEFLVASWLDPKDAKAHAAAGQVYVRLSKWADAVNALQRALALDNNLREARYALGTALMRSGKTEEARRELELFARQQAEAEAAGQREFQLDALRRQAGKDTLAGKHDEAIARFREALAIDPSARSQRDVGVALIRAKRFAEAIEPLRAAQQVEETAEAFAMLIEALSSTGDTNEADRQRGLYRQHLARANMERIRELGGR